MEFPQKGPVLQRRQVGPGDARAARRTGQAVQDIGRRQGTDHLRIRAGRNRSASALPSRTASCPPTSARWKTAASFTSGPKNWKPWSWKDPTVHLTMMRVMARRLKDAMDMIDSLSLKQVPSRLMAYFESRQQDGVVNLDLSYRDAVQDHRHHARGAVANPQENGRRRDRLTWTEPRSASWETDLFP